MTFTQALIAALCSLSIGSITGYLVGLRAGCSTNQLLRACERAYQQGRASALDELTSAEQFSRN